MIFSGNITPNNKIFFCVHLENIVPVDIYTHKQCYQKIYIRQDITNFLNEKTY